MKIAIHQPNFMPWLGYFSKMKATDYFVFLDDVQYSKNSFINRNQIKTQQGEIWITIPVQHSGKFGQQINQCRVANKHQALKVLRSIEVSYIKAPYFGLFFEEFRQLFQAGLDSQLADFNITLIKWVAQKLELKTTFILSSSLLVETNSTERLVDICRSQNCSMYVSGAGGFKYQDVEIFKMAGIEVVQSKFHHPVYPQLYDHFIPNMSVLDAFFNIGAKETAQLI